MLKTSIFEYSTACHLNTPISFTKSRYHLSSVLGSVKCKFSRVYSISVVYPITCLSGLKTFRKIPQVRRPNVFRYFFNCPQHASDNTIVYFSTTLSNNKHFRRLLITKSFRSIGFRVNRNHRTLHALHSTYIKYLKPDTVGRMGWVRLRDSR